MRKRWRWDPELKDLVPIEDTPPTSSGVFVSGDLAPYQSQITGQVIEGRAAHREHLKQHGVVEVGDAYDKALPAKAATRTPDPRRKELIARLVYEKLRY